MLVMESREDCPVHLVHVCEDREVATTTLVLADGLGQKHSSVMRLVQRYGEHLRRYGDYVLARTDTRPGHGGRAMQYAVLREPQATFLLTLFRNSETVVEFKCRLVMEFYKLRWALQNRSGRSAQRDMRAVFRDIDTLLCVYDRLCLLEDRHVPPSIVDSLWLETLDHVAAG